MNNRWTHEDLADYRNSGKARPRTRNRIAKVVAAKAPTANGESSPSKRRKYSNVPTFVGEQRFDSKKEAERYMELRTLEAKGSISDLRCQVPFTFEYGRVKIGTYKSDFTYTENGIEIVEDVKSVATRDLGVYRLKSRSRVGRVLISCEHRMILGSNPSVATNAVRMLQDGDMYRSVRDKAAEPKVSLSCLHSGHPS